MRQITDEELTRIVHQARCPVCDGKGFRRARAEDASGTPIPGEAGYVDCRVCHGDGIRIVLCRRLERECSEKS